MFGLKAVEASPEYWRIHNLPRRTLDQSLAAARKWTARLRRPTYDPDCNCRQKFNNPCILSLLAVQGIMLEEASKAHGLIAFAGVGCGKTLTSLLLPMVIPGCDVALLLIPPSLRHQFFEIDYPRYSRHWQVPTLHGRVSPRPGVPVLHVMAYSELSSPKSSDRLLKLAPKLIIADEAHNLAASGVSRTSRFKRQFAAIPGTKHVAMSGTLCKTKIADYAHLSDFALREGSPVPRTFMDLHNWDAAMAEGRNGAFVAFGALENLCKPGQSVPEAFQERLSQTAGVVITRSESCDIPLFLRRLYPEIPETVNKLIAQVRSTMTRPDGEELLPSDKVEDRIEFALTVAQVVAQLTAGFYMRWTFPRGETQEQIREWLMCRRDWTKALREKLEHPRVHMDSPALLALACKRWHEGFVHNNKHIPPHTNHPLTWDEPAYEAWKEVEDTVHPVAEPVWISDFLIQAAAKWAEKNTGIIWTENPCVGEAIAKATGLKYYGAGEEGNKGIVTAPGNVSCVASIKAHHFGKNLQQWSRFLTVQPPSSSDVWEQKIGREHRPGQHADKIVGDIFAHGVFGDRLQRAIDLSVSKRVQIGQNYRLLFAKWLNEGEEPVIEK